MSCEKIGDNMPRRDPVRRCALFLCLSIAAGALAANAAGPPRQTEQRAPCASTSAQRRPHFGDTHVHTTYSQDASTQDTRVTPRDAYRFARGEPLGIQPYDESGAAGRTVQLEAPLDFVAVTDHAEQIGEVHICKTPGAPGHDSLVCRIYRSAPRVAFFLMNGRYSALGGRWGFCGEDDRHCLAAARTVWQSTQDAAEAAYDRSADCAFTSFVAYEWTAGPGGGAHLHRNVIFRNSVVPDLPISRMETGVEAIELWRQLEAQCRLGKPGCEAVTIPHNSNLGNGYTFASAVDIDAEIGEEETPLRARYERLVEVMQHKGESECLLSPGVTDEACGFEKAGPGIRIPFSDPDPGKPFDYVRDALKRGIALGRTLGANPLKMGMIGSTDTHLGTPGLTKERGHVGHGGAGIHARDGVPPGLPDNLEFNPGGLAVLWAEENSRDALFEAMLRREAYATSGTRPVLRFFGGYDYAPDVCDAPDLAARGYAGGVAMGGDLAPGVPGAAPRLLVSAFRDPSDSAAPLQRIEIVKGWVDGDATRERIVTVAGGENGADVDLASCERRGEGSESLCGVWSDPDFDPAAPAFYYARLFENPSCRWSQWACNAAGVDCSDPATVGEGLEPCCAPDHQRSVQERAWSSPIWYTPANSSE